MQMVMVTFVHPSVAACSHVQVRSARSTVRLGGHRRVDSFVR